MNKTTDGLRVNKMAKSFLFMLTFAQLSPKHLRFSEFCGPDNVLLQALIFQA